MIDLSGFTPEQRDLWDEMFPKGIEEGATEQDRPDVVLYGFASVCLLELGSVPEAVTTELGDTPRLVGEYLENVRRHRHDGDH